MSHADAALDPLVLAVELHDLLVALFILSILLDLQANITVKQSHCCLSSKGTKVPLTHMADF